MKKFLFFFLSFTTFLGYAQSRITVIPAARCGPGSVTLRASSANGDPIAWYDNPTSGLFFALGNTYTTTLDKTTDYYVNNCNRCPRKKITATVLTKPTKPTITGPANLYTCSRNSNGTGMGTISILTIPGNTIRIYDKSIGGKLIRDSDTQYKNKHTLYLSFAFLAHNINYYVESYNPKTGCSSVRVAYHIKLIEFNIPGDVPNLTMLDDDTDGKQTFDLTQNNTLLLAHLLSQVSAADCKVNFYTDAGLTNKIPTPKNFINTTLNKQKIYFKVSFTVNETRNSSNCWETGSFDVIVKPATLTINEQVSESYCDDDGVLDRSVIVDLNTFKQKISQDTSLKYTFFKNRLNANNNINPITNVDTYDVKSSYLVSTSVSQPSYAPEYSIFARVENKSSRHKIAKITMIVNTPSKLDSSYQKTITKCDNDTDGIQTFNLSSIKKEIEDKFTQRIDVTFYEKNTSGKYQNITDIKNYRNKTPHQQKLSVRIRNAHCTYTGEHITLNVVQHTTALDITATNKGVLCNNKPVTLSINNPKSTKSYRWIDENYVEIGRQKSIQVNKKGIYKGIITTIAGCDIEKTINIQLAKPIPISVKNLNLYYENDNNMLSINEGIGLYIFALDGDKDYKQIPEFRNITAGEHTLYVREKNNHCSLKTIVFNTIKIDKYFSPNGDGINDYWKIRGVDANFHKNSTIIIMNRNGNIFYHGALPKEGWDGKDGNGKDLPYGSYWYKISLTNGSKKIQEIVGNFVLLR